MRKTLFLILTCILLLSAHAHANLCDSVKDRVTTAETKNDVTSTKNFSRTPPTVAAARGTRSSYSATGNVTPKATRSPRQRPPPAATPTSSC